MFLLRFFVFHQILLLSLWLYIIMCIVKRNKEDKIMKALLWGMFLALFTACTSANRDCAEVVDPMSQAAVFSSADKNLEKTFNWAKAMAWLYAHDESDPVGYWYESALPHREAFCMRDVSHQSVGGQILGMTPHNKNMFFRFAENISEGKDWCSYWEINRYNKPAPADYENDSSFWYNLNANFDVLQACMKMYEWTGDADYLKNEVFVNFYDRTVNDYVERWDLQPEKAFSRARYMNTAENFDANKSFHRSRGLSSYAENFPGITMSIDLLSTIYAGYNAYAEMAALNGEEEKAQDARAKAASYKQIVEEKYWNEEKKQYNTFWIEAGEFKRGEGVPFALWFDVSDNPERICAAVKDILSMKWNVENLSAFPSILYKKGFMDDAYRFLVSIPKMNRSEYPEVSFGMVEGIVCGAMGIVPSYSKKQISTCSRLKGDATESAIKNVPMFGGYISVSHKEKSTEIVNNTPESLTWEVTFMGDYAEIMVDGKKYGATQFTDAAGNVFSKCSVDLAVGKRLGASVQ